MSEVFRSHDLSIAQGHASIRAGIHVFSACSKQDVDGRDKPGQDDLQASVDYC
jgi:hypothetical protein